LVTVILFARQKVFHCAHVDELLNVSLHLGSAIAVVAALSRENRQAYSRA
jgi:hypothetical protein